MTLLLDPTSNLGTVVLEDVARELAAAVAAELSDQRKDRDVSYDLLAEDTQISRRTLVRMLQGTTSIDVYELARIAGALGTDPGVVIRNAQARARRGR